jgi:hypothetical protein
MRGTKSDVLCARLLIALGILASLVIASPARAALTAHFTFGNSVNLEAKTVPGGNLADTGPVVSSAAFNAGGKIDGAIDISSGGTTLNLTLGRSMTKFVFRTHAASAKDELGRKELNLQAKRLGWLGCRSGVDSGQSQV